MGEREIPHSSHMIHSSAEPAVNLAAAIAGEEEEGVG